MLLRWAKVIKRFTSEKGDVAVEPEVRVMSSEDGRRSH